MKDERDWIRLKAPEPEAPTLRDMFAMAALQGLLYVEQADHTGDSVEAYKYADAMLKARKS